MRETDDLFSSSLMFRVQALTPRVHRSEVMMLLSENITFMRSVVFHQQEGYGGIVYIKEGTDCGR
jgi:hypothetical protein